MDIGHGPPPGQAAAVVGVKDLEGAIVFEPVGPLVVVDQGVPDLVAVGVEDDLSGDLHTCNLSVAGRKIDRYRP